MDDLIDGLIRLMDAPDDFTGPVNLGNPGEFTIGELAAKIIDKTGSGAAIRFEPLPTDDPRQRQPDIALAEARLGWRPIIDLDQGLAPTIAHFRKLLAV